MIKQIFEPDAPEEVRNNYVKIREALQLPKVPLFFTYLGSFPEYLNYLTGQVVDLLENQRFDDICFETSLKTHNQIKNNIVYSEEITDWISRYKHSPSFYNFQKDLQHIFLNNIKLVFVFISLREALKGWAVAAKKLPTAVTSNVKQNTEQIKNELIFDDFYNVNNDQIIKSGSFKFTSEQNEEETAITKRDAGQIEKDLLPEYLHLCRINFIDILKNPDFLGLRIEVERNILNTIDLLPNIIFSPINIVLQYTSRNPDFPDLLYLLSEHFPTYAVQRMLFSGYMIE